MYAYNYVYIYIHIYLSIHPSIHPSIHLSMFIFHSLNIVASNSIKDQAGLRHVSAKELIGMLPPVVGGGLSILFNESLGFLPAEHLRHIKFLAGRWGRCHLKGGKVDRKKPYGNGKSSQNGCFKGNYSIKLLFCQWDCFGNGKSSIKNNMAMGNHL